MDDLSLLYMRGTRLLGERQLVQAAEVFQQILSRQNNHIGAIHGLGSVFMENGQVDEAAKFFQHAISLASHIAPLHLSLGNTFLYRGMFEQAIDHFQQAISIDPNYAQAFNNIGSAKRELNRVSEAIECFQQALKVNPSFVDAQINLAMAYQDLEQIEDALRAFEAVVRRYPDRLDLSTHIVHLKQQLCEWNNLDSLTRELIDKLGSTMFAPDVEPVPPFPILTLHQETSPELQQRVALAWTEGPRGIYRVLKASNAATFPNLSTDREKRLRVGYLSADFRAHPTAFLISGLLEQHNREKLEVFAYSYGPNDGSLYRRRIEMGVDVFRDIATLDFEATARRIRDDGIDILVDLKGHTQFARAEILGLRPAPIQVNYLGYPGTMGSSCVDYIVADSKVIDQSDYRWFSEQVVCMPSCYQCNDRIQSSDRVASRAEFGLPDDRFIFAAFNNSYKVSRSVFEIWLRLLRRLPSSKIWLLESNPTMRKNLTAFAAERGVAEDRLIFAPIVDRETHLSRLALADLFLDTFPCSGHTTASDAIRAGLPMVTCVGRAFPSRVAGSLLAVCRLNELITTNLQDYERVALEFATTQSMQSQLRERLVDARVGSSLFDTKSFAEELETLYRQMWYRYCDRSSITPFV